MKKITVLTMVLGLIAWMGGGLRANAQDMGLKATFTLATGFYAGGAKLPAGTYTVRQSQDDSSVYTVQNSAGSHQVKIVGQSSAATAAGGKTDVVFNRYGTAEYLVGVDTATGTSVTFNTGVAEKAAAKKGTPQKRTVPAK